MISEEYMKELWECHKERLLRISGCFPSSIQTTNSEMNIQSQFEDFFFRFITNYIKMGGKKIQDRILAFNFSLPQIDSLSTEDTNLPSEFLECFRLSLYMFLQYKITQQSNTVFQMNRDKCSLPVFKEKNTIISSVHQFPVTIIIGDTGCGKSTQIPQYLVSAGWSHIVCTQPRRLSTISLSERVSKEMYCEGTDDIGYQIRFESKGRGKKLKFVTEGVLLKQIQSDPLLKQYSVVIVDEVHERHITTDMLLAILKIIVHRRKDFRVIIMSATMEPQKFIDFFTSPLSKDIDSLVQVNVITIPGRTYPVTIHYCPPEEDSLARRRGPREERENPLNIPDSSLDPLPYLHILKEIDSTLDANERGDVLIFVSGLQEINILVNALSEFASSSGRWVLLRLHSTLLPSEQQLIFNPTQPGVRKCILSTNIAETSVTIPNVRYVIDSGKNKELSEPSLSSGTTVQLHECYISRSSARQRAGRAGRTGPGVCYRLYSEDDYYEMMEYTIPEILRGNLDDSVLLIQLFQAIHILPVSTTLSTFPFLDKPADHSLQHSLQRLQSYTALNEEYQITPLGCLLSHLPLPIAHGYFLLLSTLFNHPYDGALLCSSLTFQSLFLNRSPQSSIELNHRHSFDCPEGDLLSNLFILHQFIQTRHRYHSAYKWCSHRMLSYSNCMNCMNIVTQLLSILSSTHLIHKQSSSLIERESFHKRQAKEKQRDSILKKRRIEILDIRHNDELQRESEFSNSIDPSTVETDQTVEDIEDTENEILLSSNHSNSTVNIDTLYQILKNSSMYSKELSFLSKDMQLFFAFLLSTVFYPNLAIASKANAIRPSNEWTFLTQATDEQETKETFIYPTSCVLNYYNSNPDPKLEYPLKDKILIYEKVLDTKKPYLTNVTVLPLVPGLLLLAKEIDLDDEKHILIDKWIYLTFDNSISSTQLLKLIEQSQILRYQLKHVLDEFIQSLHDLPNLAQVEMNRMKENVDKQTTIQSIHNDKQQYPKQILEMKERIENCSLSISIEDLQMRIIDFLKIKIHCSIEDIGVSKVKALFGLIPSCEEKIAEIKMRKKEKGDAISSLENTVNSSLTTSENELFVDYSSRLGIADSLTSLSSFQRKGIQISPWVWYGSLQTTAMKATVEFYPDLISDKMTVRWDCPVCKEVLYVTREELLDHLNHCVK